MYSARIFCLQNIQHPLWEFFSVFHDFNLNFVYWLSSNKMTENLNDPKKHNSFEIKLNWNNSYYHCYDFPQTKSICKSSFEFTWKNNIKGNVCIFSKNAKMGQIMCVFGRIFNDFSVKNCNWKWNLYPFSFRLSI